MRHASATRFLRSAFGLSRNAATLGLVTVRRDINVKKIVVVNNRFARILNFHYQGYAVVEVCERLRLTSTNFYSILSRARSMLELCLEKGDVK